MPRRSGTDAAFAVILSRRPRVLIVQKADGTWGLPGGRLERGETPEDAVEREVREESGLRLSGARLVFSIRRAGRRTYLFILPKRRTRGRLLGPCREIRRQRWVLPGRARRLLTDGHAAHLARALPKALKLD